MERPPAGNGEAAFFMPGISRQKMVGNSGLEPLTSAM